MQPGSSNYWEIKHNTAFLSFQVLLIVWDNAYIIPIPRSFSRITSEKKRYFFSFFSYTKLYHKQLDGIIIINLISLQMIIMRLMHLAERDTFKIEDSKIGFSLSYASF